jgi:hypothetical protein
MNRAASNVVVNCRAFTTGNWETRENFITDTDPGFVDGNAMNFQLRYDSVVFEKLPGFQPIPFERIGLVRDELRSEVERR